MKAEAELLHTVDCSGRSEEEQEAARRKIDASDISAKQIRRAGEKQRRKAGQKPRAPKKHDTRRGEGKICDLELHDGTRCTFKTDYNGQTEKHRWRHEQCENECGIYFPTFWEMQYEGAKHLGRSVKRGERKEATAAAAKAHYKVCSGEDDVV